MNTFFQAVCFTVVALQCSALQKDQILMINDELQSYVFNCASGQLVALSADKKSIFFFYDIIDNQVSSPDSVPLPLPGLMFKVSEDGKHVAVAHDSYLSIIKKTISGHSVTTHPNNIAEPFSMVIVNNLVCIITQWQCFNMESNKTCSPKNAFSADGDGYASTNIVKDWVYMPNLGISPQSLYKFNVSSKTHCLEYVQDTGFYDYDYGRYLWFSYDGSRIFLDSGLTLASSDDDSDMKPHGDFNSSYDTYTYSYFSQSSKPPYLIAGIRTDLNDTVFYYDWPYLNPVKSEKIPVPPEGQMNGAEEIHNCDDTSMTYLIVKYWVSGSIKLGIVIRKSS